jgi:ABC-type multidrug transport system fused ATPase/permease subunit
MLHALQCSFGLLAGRERLRLIAFVAIQVFLAFLDLLGILLLGLVAGLAASTFVGGSGAPPSTGPLGSLQPVAQMPLALIAGIAAISLMGKTLLTALVSRKMFAFYARVEANTSARLASALLSQPIALVNALSSQQRAYTLTTSVNSAVLGVLGSSSVMASEFALILVITVGLMFVDPVVAAFALAFFGLIGALLYFVVSRWASGLGQRSTRTFVACYEAIQEALLAQREIWVSGRQPIYVRNYHTVRKENALVEASHQMLGLLPKYVFELALIVGAGALVLSQFVGSSDPARSVGILAVFLIAASRLMPSMLRIQTAALTLRTSASQAAPAYQLASEFGVPAVGKLSISEHVVSQMLQSIANNHDQLTVPVLVQEASYTYPSAHQPALKDITISVPAGYSTAIVGRSGAGKSTLADLILGVAVPSAGSVEIGGMKPGDIAREHPGAIGYVPQEVAILSGTIRSNVALGLPESKQTDELVWEALERAHLINFLREARLNLDSKVGEHGFRLSGGQRQRLGIARALFPRPKLLVLDEATSALDAETESLVSETVRDLNSALTTFVIAHRLATVVECDLVIYLDNGEVRAQGSFVRVRELVPDFDAQSRLLGL